ncbi:MAG: hypothetical protein ACXVH3_36065 [Solirubrobacteraceae bacterium]
MTGRVKRSPQRSFYVWVAVVLAVAVAAVILAWHSGGGTPDPTDAGVQMSRTSAVVNSAVLVFREGLETILVLAAVLLVVGSYLGAQYLRVWRPRRRHERVARLAEEPPERPARAAGTARTAPVRLGY